MNTLDYEDNEEDILDIESDDELNEKLSIQQRMAKSRTMKRIASKLKAGRRRAAKKISSPEKIKQKTLRLARKQVAQKLLSRMGKTPDDLSFAEKERLERELKKRQPLIDRLKIKLLPKVKKAEMDKFKTNENYSYRSFKSYCEDYKEKNKIIIYVDSFNPPTKSHGEILNLVSNLAESNTYRIYSNYSHDSQENPIAYNDKIKFIRKMFPKHARNVIYDPTIVNESMLLNRIHEEGFNDITIVNVSKNRRNSLNENYSDVEVLNLDVESFPFPLYTSEEMRNYAYKNDFSSFISGLPNEFEEKRELFNSIRAGMGLKESFNFRSNVKISPAQKDLRDSYINGNVYSIGDIVKESTTGKLYKIEKLGSNYLVVESIANKSKKRVWLNMVEKVSLEKDKDDPCWKGYVALGTKMKDGKEVPNCVPIKSKKG